MYSNWVSGDQEIVEDKSHLSVLHSFPQKVSKEVASILVTQFNKDLCGNVECKTLSSSRQVDWAMEVICYGLSLPIIEKNSLLSCVNIYTVWLSALIKPKLSIPHPVIRDPEVYARRIFQHLRNLFVPRINDNYDQTLIDFQVGLCEKTLQDIFSTLSEVKRLKRDTWNDCLKFLLWITNCLLAAPVQNGDLGDRLSTNLLSTLFRIWLLACSDSFPDPTVWKALNDMCKRWRHHRGLVEQWNHLNLALSVRLDTILHGKFAYKRNSQNVERDYNSIAGSFSDSNAIQCWFRFLHIIGNPVELSKYETIARTPKLMEAVYKSEIPVDFSQVGGLSQLPQLFLLAMQGLSNMVDVFLRCDNRGICQMHDTIKVAALSASTRIHAIPSNKDLSKMYDTEGSDMVSSPSGSGAGVSGVGSFTSLTTSFNSNTVLHLLGSWLFQASQIKINAAERLFEAGKAEACGALCRLFSVGRCDDAFLDEYLSRFYTSIRYGLQISEHSKGQTMANIILNSANIFRCDLKGVLILLPYYIQALERILPYKEPKIGAIVPKAELRRCAIHILLSILSLPLHFYNLSINVIPEVVSDDQTVGNSNNATVSSFRLRIINLMLLALQSETDSVNTQMILGGLLLLTEDTVSCANLWSDNKFDFEYFIKVQEVEDSTFAGFSASITDGIDSESSSMGGIGSSLQQFTRRTASSVLETYKPRASTRSEGAISIHDHVDHVFPKRKLATDFDHPTSLYYTCVIIIGERLEPIWKTDFNVTLMALEVLSDFAHVPVISESTVTSKKIIDRICQYIEYQIRRPPRYQSRDLHSMIVAAFSCLLSWISSHNQLMEEEDCLKTVLNVIEQGIAGISSEEEANLTSQEILKGNKMRKPASGRVREAAESVLFYMLNLMDAFPSPCGPATTSSLLDEDKILSYLNSVGISDQVIAKQEVNFIKENIKYYSSHKNSIIGLLEIKMADNKFPPIAITILRNATGRYTWVTQLRHHAINDSKLAVANLRYIDRPRPMDNLGSPDTIQHSHFPTCTDRIQHTKCLDSIPQLEAVVDAKTAGSQHRIKKLLSEQTRIEEEQFQNVRKKKNLNVSHPNTLTEATQPSPRERFDTARMILSHLGLLNLDNLQAKSTELLESFVHLEISDDFYHDLQMLDDLPCRSNETVYIFYAKRNQKTLGEIVRNMDDLKGLHNDFIEFVHSLGWPVDPVAHPGWCGDISTPMKKAVFASPLYNSAEERPFSKPKEADITDTTENGSDNTAEKKGSKNSVCYYGDAVCEIGIVLVGTSVFPRFKLNESTASVGAAPIKKLVDIAPLAEIESLQPTMKNRAVLSNNKGKLHRQGTIAQVMDRKAVIIWLEKYEDYLSFPIEEVLLELGISSIVDGTRRGSASSGSGKTTERDSTIIFIYPLRNGLYRIHMTLTSVVKGGVAGPLIHGMTVSKRVLGKLTRQTVHNIASRQRLEIESASSPFLVRKNKIQDIIKRHQYEVAFPDYYLSFF